MYIFLRQFSGILDESPHIFEQELATIKKSQSRGKGRSMQKPNTDTPSNSSFDSASLVVMEQKFNDIQIDDHTEYANLKPIEVWSSLSFNGYQSVYIATFYTPDECYIQKTCEK